MSRLVYRAALEGYTWGGQELDLAIDSEVPREPDNTPFKSRLVPQLEVRHPSTVIYDHGPVLGSALRLVCTGDQLQQNLDLVYRQVTGQFAAAPPTPGAPQPADASKDSGRMCPSFIPHEKDPLIGVYSSEYFVREYDLKYDLVKKLYDRVNLEGRTMTVCEVGVRLGYGAHAIAAALIFRLAKRLVYVGIDAYCDELQDLASPYASKVWFNVEASKLILSAFDAAELRHVKSTECDRFPEADLYHIDADHSYEGCCHDLDMAWKSAKINAFIIVDDAVANREVNRACHDFYKLHGAGMFHSGGNGNFVVQKT